MGMVAPAQVITLREYTPLRLPADALSREAGTRLWQQFGQERRVLDVAFPSPRTGECWELTSLGYAGHIPLAPSLHLHLQPRIPLASLFRVLAYTYRLEEIDFLPGLIGIDSLRELVDHLAHYLAQVVLARRRRGLYQAYVSRREALPVVRGRIHPRWQAPPQPQLDCEFEEHTADVPENQLLAWTLRSVARSGLCHEPAQTAVRRAYHSLAGVTAAPVPWPPSGWTYHPLNTDYAPLHALCRFLLAHTGPGHQLGEQRMVPFLVDMAHLYEQFVARWLQRHLPTPWQLRVQERVEATGEHPLRFTLDLVIYDRAGRASIVLDTKYKAEVTAADVQQIVTYAQLRDCREAVLVYPEAPHRGLDVQAGDIRVRALTFPLDGEMDSAGSALLAALGLAAAATFSPYPL